MFNVGTTCFLLGIIIATIFTQKQKGSYCSSKFHFFKFNLLFFITNKGFFKKYKDLTTNNHKLLISGDLHIDNISCLDENQGLMSIITI